MSNQLDFFMFNEPWLSPGCGVALNETGSPGFNYFHQCRVSGRGGGLAVIHKENFMDSLYSLGN